MRAIFTPGYSESVPELTIWRPFCNFYQFLSKKQSFLKRILSFSKHNIHYASIMIINFLTASQRLQCQLCFHPVIFGNE